MKSHEVAIQVRVSGKESFKENVKILVTGALGHIGSALIRDPALVLEASELVLIDNLTTQRFPSVFELPAGVKYSLLPFDVESVMTIALAGECDAVVHLAAISDPAASVANPQWLYDNNLRITQHVVRTCLASQTPLVFVSTTSVYTSDTGKVDEQSPTDNPTTPYARCKLEEESLVLEAMANGLAGVIYRLGTIFGISPGMRFHTAVNKFCWQAATGQMIEVWRTALDQRRPYLDLNDARVVLARTVLERLYPGEIVNAVTCDVTVAEVLKIIQDCGVETRIRLVDSPVMNDLSFTTSTARALGHGLRFQGSLDAQIRSTLQMLGHLGPR